MNQCPHCRSTERQVKSGHNRTGSQRLQCQLCRRQYTPRPNPLGYDDKTREQALKLYLEGNGLRRIGRLLGVNHQSVANWVNSAHSRLRAKESAAPAAEEAGRWRWTSCSPSSGLKKPAYIVTLVERATRLVVAHEVCRERTPEVMQRVIDSASHAASHYSDAFNTGAGRSARPVPTSRHLLAHRRLRLPRRRVPGQAGAFRISTVEAMSAGAVPGVYGSGGQREIVTHGTDGFC